jgi:ubiquinone/menaquinone biosynthesis C-methylase UbiE
MYTRSVQFYDAIHHFKDYSAASGQLQNLLQRQHSTAKTLLDVACGTGKHLEYLRNYYQVEGIDVNPDMLKIARQRCPEVPFHPASMVDFCLESNFDVITCLFSSIAYVKTRENLEKTLYSMVHHLRPGGVVVIEPFFSPKNYWTGTVTANFVDEPDLKIAWMYISNPPQDRVAVLDIHYLVGTPDSVDRFEERHELGLFTHEEYLKAFRGAGLEVTYDSKGLFGRGMYLGKDLERKNHAIDQNT